MDPTSIEFPKGFMDDNGNEVDGENKPNSSQTPYYNVKSQGHTYVGDGTTVNISKDKRKTTNVVNVYNVNIVQPNNDDKKGLPADCRVPQLTGVSEEEKKPNDDILSSDDSEEPYDDVSVKKVVENGIYLKPIDESVLEKVEILDADNETEVKKKGAECNETKIARTIDNFAVLNSVQAERNSNFGKSERLDETLDDYCTAKSELEKKKMMKIIHKRLNSLSANFNNNCNIYLAESKLRAFLLLNNDTLINDGINLYASLLTVMVQNSLQLINERSLKSLLTRLERIVEPSSFSGMSRVRRDIETVISLLSAFTKKLKDNKIRNVMKLITKIKEDPSKESLDRNLKKYLESKCWMQHYLVLSSLKMQVLGQVDEDLMAAFIQVIDWLSASLSKMDPSYRWKFIVTVVDSLAQIAREVPDPARKKAIDYLSSLYFVLQEKKLRVCIGLFRKRAQVLVFIQDMNIRSNLLEGIFKDLDTDTEEMCRERLELCKDLPLTAIGSRLHSGNHAWIFSAYSNSFEVVAKCYKEKRNELLERNLGSQLSYCEYECKCLNQLHHPNIIRLIAFDERVKCVLLESVSDGNLLNVLRNRRSDALVPTLTELLWIAVNIADALKYLEQKDIVHLAVQAGNVLLHERYTGKLTGFQFCRTWRQIDEFGVRKAIEKRHFKWMDPQALRFESLHPKTVSWSFGVFLYELLTLGCVPYNNHGSCSERGDFERKPFTSLKARIFVIRGGKPGKETCIPKDIYSIINENCFQKNYSSRASPQELEGLLHKQINNSKASDKISAPPELILNKEDLNPENYNPGIDDDDDFPFAHLDVLEHVWNKEYLDHEFANEEGYTNADPFQCEPVLCVIKRQQEGKECEEICVLEYMEFKDIKLVEKLQTLNCPELIKVIAVNPYGPHTLEMISESFPQGNILDAMLQRPELRLYYKLYIYQAAAAVSYLHQQGIVHRNLKVENYLLANDQSIKLGCLGMSMEEVDPNALYFETIEKTKIITDARRDAPEVLNYGFYSQKSDVWSFGVVVWEFVSVANSSGTKRQDVLPYSHVSDNEVLGLVMEQNMLQNPDRSSQFLYNVYKRCCNWYASDRPKASTVHTILRKRNYHLIPQPALKQPVRSRSLPSRNYHLMHELSPKPLVRSWSVPSRMDLIPISYSHDGHLQILEELLKSNDGYSDENMYETYSIASTNTDEHMTWGKVEQHSGQSHRNAKSGHYSLASIFNKFKKYSSEKSINLKPRSPSDKNQEIEQELDEDHYEIIEELKSPGVLKKSLKRSQREEMNKDDPDTPPPVPPRKSTFYVNIKYDDETAPSFQPRKFPPNKAAYVNEIYETKDCSDDNHYDNTCEVPDAEEMSDDVTGDMKNDKIIDKCTHEYSEVFKCDDGEKYETNEEHAVQKMISDNFARSVLSRFYSQEWPEEDFDGDVYEETNTCGNKSREQPHELQEPQGKVEEKLDEKVTSENDSYLEEMRFGNSDSSAGHLTNDAIDDSDIALNIGNKGHVKNVLSLFSKNS